jgi:phosphate transport system substrate-binding protein
MKKLALFVLIWSLTAPLRFWGQQATIQLQGPDTLILLGQKLSQLYQRTHPTVSLRVHGGGVQAALPLLIKGDIDLAQTQGMLPAEDARNLLAVPVGVEGIVLYVHELNPINELSVAQVRAIYTGQILNWKQLGGADQRILLYGGESTSGIGPFFAESVLRGEESFGYEGKNSTKDLLDVIAEHSNAVGFGGVGSAPHVKALRIRSSATTRAVEPTIAMIRSLEYPISRHIYWYLARKPQGAVRDLCDWIFSSEGQLVVEGVGFQPLAPEERSKGLRKLGLSSDPVQQRGTLNR